MRLTLIVLLVCSVAAAHDVISSGDITLLALTDNGTGKDGSVAKLKLELRPGMDRVYLETFPMTKITTQASLRFAQQIACKELSVDCSEYDFLFSVEALPGIVGGPSAGSAATLLSSALLLNESVPKDVAITGTINSGGTIGPVGGLNKKIEAASRNGVRLVMIPQGTREFEVDNATVDLVELGESLNLTVREVATIADVLGLVFDVQLADGNKSLSIDPEYALIMRQVSEDLCSRLDAYDDSLMDENEVALNFSRYADSAMSNASYYAAASFCFRANVELKKEWYAQQNLSVEELVESAKGIKEEALKVRTQVSERELNTLSDLQTFMAVSERVDEVLEILKKEEKKKGNSSADQIAYAEERLFSAVTWSRFFELNGQQVGLDMASLRDSCAAKISEAEERYNYVKSVLPDALTTTMEEIGKAYADMKKKEFVMCLYRASKAKAEADVLLSLMGVKEERFEEVLDLKLNVTRDALIRAQHNKVFPIIAYSYYEYSRSLRSVDRVSALLFAEYALELAHIDIYFEEIREPEEQVEVVEPWMFEGVAGLGLLVLIVMIVLSRRAPSKRRSKPKQAPKRLQGKKR